jgi:hypothetical protein
VGLDAVGDRVLAEVRRLCDPQRTDSEVRLLVKLFESLLGTFRDDRLREMFDLFVDIGPLEPRERWSRERWLRSALETEARPRTVELRRDGPLDLRWRRTRAEDDGFEASGAWQLDEAGRVVAATIEDLTSTTGVSWARVQRRWTYRLSVR